MYQITGESFYKDKLSEVLEFVERDLSHGEGACYASLDADSEGIEGRYYIWTFSEFESVCKDHKNLLCEYFGLTRTGNWEEGYNILNIQSPIEELSGKYNLDVKEISTIVSECKNKLFKKRDEREKPMLDDKILTSWNALMITAWCDAFQATGKTEYRSKALTLANFIQNHLYDQNSGRLKRSHGMKINGFLDDYALLSEAFIKLYQISFEEKWMNRAKRLILHSLDHFYDADRNMFFYSPDYESNPVSRQTEITDNVIPSSNSVMARVLFLTGIFFDEGKFTGISKQMLLNTQPYLRKSPEFFANWGSLLLLYTHKFSEVVLTGDNARELREDFCGKYLPDVLFALSNGPSDLPLLKDRYREGENLIYVCRNQSCQLPVKEVDKALEQLEE